MGVTVAAEGRDKNPGFERRGGVSGIAHCRLGLPCGISFASRWSKADDQSSMNRLSALQSRGVMLYIYTLEVS
ncbi:hypothetical protein FHS89_002404 [Rubricella aquisinus]|uniref:Uncharacterized protein n=1 Tax=Rubricella aquisinus TaxID=2028108 RepID=A0A840WQQ3_9RHOB|nr:hypothetical protein [Rubricella aquisinus]MBB5516373.1 hypothetical protein [Rubricella aquisinus]